MYKCTECSEEYKEKPDYCKCGNDEFEEFTTITPTESARKNEKTVKTSISDIPIKNILSITFFALCIVIAIIPWLIKAEKPQKKVQKPQPEINKIIPNIENIWENTTYTKPSQIDEIKAVKVVDNNALKQLKQQKQTHIQKFTPQNIQKNISTAKPAASKLTQTSKPNAATTKPKQETNKLQIPIKLPPSVINPKQTQTKVSSPAPVAKTEPPKMNQSEFLQYKGAVRTALLTKLNLTAIQGSGDCAVEFSLDSTGKLINRNFIYKSTNKTVNDEVYMMLMRLPYYKQPPAHYNGEKIKLKFYIYNGYYEITFI